MNRQPWGMYATALGVLVVGLVWAGVPAQTLLFAALVLVCPLTMLFMHRAVGHGGHDTHDQREQHDHDATARR